MAYKSKNLGISRRKASTKRAETSDNLFSAIRSLDTFKQENKELEDLTKKVNESTQAGIFVSRYLKDKAEDKQEQRTKYDSWKEKFDQTVKDNKYEDIFFPEFNDWYSNSTKAKIDGKFISESDMNFEYDPEQINMLMQMMMEQDND